MKAENYITIQGWMRTELNLKGNDLLVYAIIYGFSQTESQAFIGSLQYLADWCGATKQGILKNLKNLLDLGFIEKQEQYHNNVKFVKYYTTKFNGGIQHSLTNNINKQTNSNKLFISKDINNSRNLKEIESFIKLYHEICVSLPKAIKLTDKRKRGILNLIKKYDYTDIKTVFYNLENSDFCKGKNNRGWKADIDFLLREDKFVAIFEGKYNNSKSRNLEIFGETDEVSNEGYTKEELERNTNGKRTYF